MSHTTLQYSSTLFAEFIVQLLQGFVEVPILLTYRSNNFNVQDFIGQLTHLITFHKPHLVLGDFNINALRDSSLIDTMRQYGYTWELNQHTYWVVYWIIFILKVMQIFLGSWHFRHSLSIIQVMMLLF